MVYEASLVVTNGTTCPVDELEVVAKRVRDGCSIVASRCERSQWHDGFASALLRLQRASPLVDRDIWTANTLLNRWPDDR